MKITSSQREVRVSEGSSYRESTVVLGFLLSFSQIMIFREGQLGESVGGQEGSAFCWNPSRPGKWNRKIPWLSTNSMTRTNSIEFCLSCALKGGVTRKEHWVNPRVITEMNFLYHKLFTCGSHPNPLGFQVLTRSVVNRPSSISIYLILKELSSPDYSCKMTSFIDNYTYFFILFSPGVCLSHNNIGMCIFIREQVNWSYPLWKLKHNQFTLVLEKSLSFTGRWKEEEGRCSAKARGGAWGDGPP